MNKAEQSFAPIFGRVVIFSSTCESFHGHPGALNSPPGVTRRSIALYYYTSRPADDGCDYDPSTTRFQTRPS